VQQPRLLLEGKYEILSKIREGGMGTIYRVRHRLLDEVRVVKVMQPHVVADSDLKRRFEEEAKMAIRLKHPNVCTLHDFAVDDHGTAYLVMEYIDGVNLADFLRSRGRPGVALTIEIAHQSLLALGYLHRKGVIHRDVAPDNLMLAHDEEGHAVVKLIDLGIAKAVNRAMDLTATGVFLGKLKYASPEQYGTLPPGEKIDGRSDLYGLGVVLYELLTGVRPFKGESPAELLRAHLFTAPMPFSESDPEGKVPPELRTAVFKALEKKREDRYASAEDFDREIVSLREKLVHPGDAESTAALLSTLRSTQPALSDNVTPSAQNRLDQQFGPLTTPSPSLPPFKIVLPPEARPEPRPSPGAPTVTLPPDARETEAAPDPTSGTIRAESTVINPALAAERASAAAEGKGRVPKPERAPVAKPPPARSDRLERAEPPARIATGAPAARPGGRGVRWAALLLVLGAVLAVWRPWSRRAPPVEEAATQPAAQVTQPAPAEAEPTAAPIPTALPTSAPTAAPTEHPAPAADSRLQAAVESARKATASARRDSEDARARDFAPSTYRRAAALEKQAERLSEQAEYEGARKAFESASRYYAQAEAAARAEVARVATPVRVAELPTARPTLAMAFPTAIPVAPTPVPVPPTAAPALEATRIAPVERAAPPTAAPVRGNPPEERKVRDTIRLYEQAWSRFDAKLYARVYPSGAAAFETAIRNLKSQYVNIEIRTIEVDSSATRATVTGNEVIVATPRAGTEQKSERDVTLQLQKQDDRWVIVSRS
jgi:serine/threonine-protein kinase